MNQSSTAIEQAIQAAGANVAPRVTEDDIKANIVTEHYFTAAEGVLGGALPDEGPLTLPDGYTPPPQELGLLTFCVLVLKNGFTVTGESACASPENFKPAIGRQIARENAINKVWNLMGYELRTKLAQGGAA